MSHKDTTYGDIHVVYDAVYDTRAARETATYAVGDVGKLVKQTDENSYWVVLTSGSGSATFAKASTKYGERSSITGTSETVIYTFTLPDTSSVVVSAKVHAMQSTAAERCYYWIEGLFYRNGGNATQQGSTIVVVDPIESDATPTVAFAVSGNDVQVTWTGVTSETWHVIPIVEISLNDV